MRTQYYYSLHQNPLIRLCWFLPLIKRAVATGVGVTTKEPIPLNGLDYTLYFTPEVKTGADGLITLSLRWEDEGESYTQHIPIIQEESNLVSGAYVYYFLCPFGYKSKKLFYIANKFRSSRAFRHRYYTQKKSRHQRETGYLSQDEPYRRYGKMYYRDKVTPYGKRCIRYEDRQERGLEALSGFLDKLNKRHSNIINRR